MTLQWLLPIGFLGLLGIGILLLIYIIKPSYQKRVISSSYAWQRVLKRRKELPIDRFRNILLFLVQALILAACALIFAQPNLMSPEMIDTAYEKLIVIDASASMRARYAGDPQGQTRFDRALDEVRIAMDDVVMRGDGLLSVIVADEEPYYLIDRMDKSGYADAIASLEGLSCSYGHGSVDKALELARDRVYNASTDVIVYSGTEYGDMGAAIECVNLADPLREWNVCVAGCDVVDEDNEFVFRIELCAYGTVSMNKMMTVRIKGADLGAEELSDLPALTIPVHFEVNAESAGYEQRQTIEVKATDESIGGRADFYYSSFQEAVIRVEGLEDSIADDDAMTVYGGIKDVINVQYCSGETNVFYYLGFTILRDAMRAMRDISFKQLDVEATPELSGYDLYIFEHRIPDAVIAFGLPTDGVILLVDPNRDLDELGLKFGDKVTFNEMNPMRGGEAHPLTQYIDPARNGISEYTRIMEYDSSFTPLLYCGDDPVLLCKNTPSSKIVVMPFSLNMSDFISWDFETLLYNIIEYFFPLTVTKYNYELGDTLTLNCKGESLVIANDFTSYVMRTFPTELVLDRLGAYSFTVHSGLQKEDEVRKIMVRIPHSESAIFSVADVKITLDRGEIYAETVKDLFPYFAIAVIVMLFVEWWLQFRNEA